MASQANNSVLHEAIWQADGTSVWIKRAVLVVLGIAAMTIAAKIRVPMWPVPATMQTFVVLSVGAAYGLRLGVVTLLGYLAIGLLGYDVFTSSSAELNGWAYMTGATGGYLIGFVAAAGLMGMLARAGWDRSVARMALAMLAGNAVIYLFGLPWMAYLFVDAKGWAWVAQWGIGNFLVFDALKLALAAFLFPVIWRSVGKART